MTNAVQTVREWLDRGLYEYPDPALVDNGDTAALWQHAYEQVTERYSLESDPQEMAEQHMDEVRELVAAYEARLRKRK